MKTTFILSGLTACILGAVAVSIFHNPQAVHGESKNPTHGLTVHEWGTFTSLQGGDGQLIAWQAAASSELPAFVYDWKKPGNDRAPIMQAGFGKGSFLALQRMETPVIYFYANQPQDVDVTVKFPNGKITEWYPQARDIGPSIRKNPVIHSMAVVLPRPTTSEQLKTPESLIHWRAAVLPKNADTAALPDDTSASHYFAARETDAALLQVSASNAAEYEKFLFYRGVGNFETPLRVTATNDTITLANIGKEKLNHLFLLKIHNGEGGFVSVQSLVPGEKKSFHIDSAIDRSALAKNATNIGNQMKIALEAEGLFGREAAAMVKTWDKSWFEEEGLRVLYIVPRVWTDKILPMTLQPQPNDLARVMVCRAEVIAPAVEDALVDQLTKARQGDISAKTAATATLKHYGRFAGPIFNRAFAKVAKQPGSVDLVQLYNESTRKN